MSASGLPITQLGSTIKSHLGIAEKYEGKAEEHYKSAGIHLLEAKARIAAGEYEGKFGAFLLNECNDLSSSRAYELIAIANGTTTVERQRQRARAGMRASRARAATRADAALAAMSIRNVTDKVRVLHPFSEGATREALVKRIAEACRAASAETLGEVLRLLQDSRPSRCRAA